MKEVRLNLRFDPAFDLFLKRHGKRTFEQMLTRRTTICDIVESLGVPHTEIGEIQWNNRTLPFHVIPKSDMAIHIRPVSPPLDVRKPTLLRPEPFEDLKFIVDENVAKLAPLMRILGLDAMYTQGVHDREIARTAFEECRVLLSKDIQLFKRKAVTYGHFIRAIRPLEQLREVIDFFVFHENFSPFSRCLLCNTPLIPVPKADILHLLEPKTKKYFHDFKRCTACDKVVWKGSHHEHMIASLKTVGIHL